MKHFILLVFITLIYSCNNINDKEKNNTNNSDSQNTQNIISTVTAKTAQCFEELKLNGKITFNPKNIAQIQPLFSGQVEEVLAEVGDFIEKGNILATIKSPEIVEFEKEKKSIEHRIITAKRNLEYTEDMLKSGMASERDLLQAQQELTNSEAEERKINEIFNIYKIKGNSTYNIVSPISGFVVSKNINPQMQIRSDKNEDVFIVSGLEDVWVMADIYEGDISKIKENTKVEINTLAYPDKIFNGKIDKIHHIMDENSKTMKVRIEISNKDLLLKPGMFATIKVRNTSEQKLMPTIPSEAVIFEHGKYYIVVSENGTLKTKEINIYKQVEGMTYVSSGIEDGENIVVKNSLLIYNSLKNN